MCGCDVCLVHVCVLFCNLANTIDNLYKYTPDNVPSECSHDLFHQCVCVVLFFECWRHVRILVNSCLNPRQRSKAQEFDVNFRCPVSLQKIQKTQLRNTNTHIHITTRSNRQGQHKKNTDVLI